MEINTTRLRLGPVTEDDLGAFHRLQSDPTVTRFTKQGPSTSQAMSEQQLDDLLVLVNTCSPREPILILAITEIARNELIGLVGTFRPREIGFSLHPDYQGLGYAQEAVRSFCQWYEESYQGQKLFAKVNTENEGSMKCLRRCGFGRASETENKSDEAFRKDSTRETWLLRETQ